MNPLPIMPHGSNQKMIPSEEDIRLFMEQTQADDDMLDHATWHAGKALPALPDDDAPYPPTYSTSSRRDIYDVMQIG